MKLAPAYNLQIFSKGHVFSSSQTLENKSLFLNFLSYIVIECTNSASAFLAVASNTICQRPEGRKQVASFILSASPLWYFPEENYSAHEGGNNPHRIGNSCLTAKIRPFTASQHNPAPPCDFAKAFQRSEYDLRRKIMNMTLSRSTRPPPMKRTDTIQKSDDRQ